MIVEATVIGSKTIIRPLVAGMRIDARPSTRAMRDRGQVIVEATVIGSKAIT